VEWKPRPHRLAAVSAGEAAAEDEATIVVLSISHAARACFIYFLCCQYLLVIHL
jgi:hypothetical protein